MNNNIENKKPDNSTSGFVEIEEGVFETNLRIEELRLQSSTIKEVLDIVSLIEKDIKSLKEHLSKLEDYDDIVEIY